MKIDRDTKIKIFANHLGADVMFDNKIHGLLRGIHMDGLLNLDVIEEWDNNTPIYKKWAIEDTKLLLSKRNPFVQTSNIELINECVILKD